MSKYGPVVGPVGFYMRHNGYMMDPRLQAQASGVLSVSDEIFRDFPGPRPIGARARRVISMRLCQKVFAHGGAG